MKKENRLAVILKDSQLEPSKVKYILEQFQGYFAIAEEWEQKAKAITVTKADQTAEMEMARTGRLFLKEKRVAVEKARKTLKEQALREGKAIDGIANVLKALIVPIENYLDAQEHFVEIKAEEKREAMRLEIETRLENERLAEEKAKAEEQERLRIENEKLKAEAEKREKKAATERKKQAAILAKEREKAEAEREVLKEKARKEREAHDKKMLEERNKARKEKEVQEEKAWIAESNAKIEREKAHKKAEAERKEKERLANILKNQIMCPRCGHKFQPKRG